MLKAKRISGEQAQTERHLHIYIEASPPIHPLHPSSLLTEPFELTRTGPESTTSHKPTLLEPFVVVVVVVVERNRSTTIDSNNPQ